MEKKFFDWEDWDTLDDNVQLFSNVTLTKAVGDFEPGESFEWARVDYERGTLTLGTGEDEFAFNIELLVTGKV